MSHTIIYNRLFIKATDKDGVTYYAPMILCGANNCTQINQRTGKEIRERSWYSFKSLMNAKNIATEQEILSSIDEERLERMKRAAENVKEFNDESWAYDDKQFGYFAGIRFSGRSTRETTFSSYRSYFSNGMKNAFTLEKLYEGGVSVRLHVSSYWKDDFAKLGLEIKPDVYPKTDEEFLSKVNEYDDYYKKVGGFFIQFLTDTSVERFLNNQKNLQKRNRIPREKKKINVNKYFVLVKENNSFFVKASKTKYYYHYNPSHSLVKKWEKYSQAERYLAKLKSKDIWHIKQIDETITLEV